MSVEITRHALDRVPLSLIIDDSAPLVNVNYFWIRDHNAFRGRDQRWQDIPVATPERFTREWAEWCGEHGVKGKFSVIPCPAGLGRIDEDLPLFGREQLTSWLDMCRRVIVPSFDITPEMLTHTWVLDLDTMRPRAPGLWEQEEWAAFTEEDRVDAYIERACRILANVGLSPDGVTSPGGFGHRSEALYARCAEQAVRAVTGNPTPYYFHDIWEHTNEIETPVWRIDRQAGTAVAEIVCCAGDQTGSWTGYGECRPDYYVTADLRGGRLPAVIDAGGACILVSHWQGMYGLHDDDRRGFRTLQTVVERLRRRDPHGETTRWRRCSEVADYACMRAMAQVEERASTAGGWATIRLDLPARSPELTLRLRGGKAQAVRAAGVELRLVGARRGFEAGCFFHEGADTLLAFDPPAGHGPVEVEVRWP